MTDRHVLNRFSERLVSRRGAWIALGLAVVIFTALFGMFGQAEAPGSGPSAPAAAESSRVSELLATFPDADRQSVLIVATRDDQGALTPGDLAALRNLGPSLDAHSGSTMPQPEVSDDGQAAVIAVPVTVGADDSDNATVIDGLRAQVADQAPPGLSLLVTGGPAFGADVAAAFVGANITLLAVTILIVAVLLIVTYRSPILWLIPLAVVAFADQLAGKVTAALGSAWGLQFDAGVISVLVFGAGTNYALLLISRYREELRNHSDHRTALALAWRKTVPAVVASNVTVVLSLLTLVFAVIPGTRGLGIAAAVGLAFALAAVLFVLPPALAVSGPKVFWPFVPSPEHGGSGGRLWRAVAVAVVRRPVVAFVSAAVVLVTMAAGLLGTSVGLSQAEQFRGPAPSATGLQVLAQHFPPGAAQPMLVVANTDEADAVARVARAVPGVASVSTAGTSSDGTLTRFVVTGTLAPGTEASLALVTGLREAVHAVPHADALVGGATATDLDARAGNHHDLWLGIALVLTVGLIVLLVLLRSLVAPLLLVGVNLVSAAAAIGAGSWLSRVAFGWPALDPQVPLLAFLFLVALGIDYTIFLVHRARAEAVTRGTRAGMVEAVAQTGGVITSAGLVLAGVFAALGVLPLVTLGQLGLIVGIGVIVDTLVVRTVMVPALFGLLGDRIWWPRRPEARSAASTAEEVRPREPVLAG